MDVVQTPTARLSLGRMIHEQYQTSQERFSPTYQRESTLKVQLDVLGWQVQLMGRVDGLLTEGTATVVEEIKSTAMDAYRLMSTDASDWPQYVAQVETYLWMMNELGRGAVTGRLVLISVLDGTRHSLGIDLGFGSVDVRIRAQLHALIERREERIRWMSQRRSRGQSRPFEEWRPGQAEILDAVTKSLHDQQPLLVEAPTGLGKTAPILSGTLQHVSARDQQVFLGDIENHTARGCRENSASIGWRPIGHVGRKREGLFERCGGLFPGTLPLRSGLLHEGDERSITSEILGATRT